MMSEQPEERDVFGTVRLEYGASVMTDSDGDLWPCAWADDGNLYTANGDGAGFSDDGFADIVANRIEGDPIGGLRGERLASGRAVSPIWGDPAFYNSKPTGIVAVDGNGDGRDELYLAVQDLASVDSANPFDSAPYATIVRSDDYGRTWHSTETPMFSNHVFTTIMFLDFGQSNAQEAVLGMAMRYVYAYGLDGNWRTSYSGIVEDPQDLYLARVPVDSIQRRECWEFFAGFDGNHDALWAEEVERKVPVLTDARRLCAGAGDDKGHTVIAQGGVVYNAPLERYFYTSWSEFTLQFYTALEPWGPWEHFHEQDFGPFPWDGPRSPHPKHGGYATAIPSKFISADGLTMWLQSNWFWEADAYFGSSYHFSLRKLELAKEGTTEATNLPSGRVNLADGSSGAVPTATYCRRGHLDVLNDGDLVRSEDSRNGLHKPRDSWGYCWPRDYTMDTLVFTSGPRDYNSGWYETTPAVQVRSEGRWREVESVEVDPPYPSDSTATGNRTYTFGFAPVSASGIRLVGIPAGQAAYTSIAELEVYYRG